MNENNYNYDSMASNFKRLLKDHLIPHYKIIIVVIILMCIVSGTTAYQAFLVQPAMDNTLFNSTNKEMLISIPIIIGVISILRAMATYYQSVVMGILNTKIMNELRLKLYKSFIYADIELYNNRSTGSMVSSLTYDLMAVMNTISIILSGTFRNLFTTLSLIGVMFYMNYKLTLISLIGVPLTVYPIYLVLKRIKKLVHQNQEHLGDFTSQIDDTLKSARVVKAYNAEEFELNRMDRILKGLAKLSFKISRYSSIPSTFTECLTGIGAGLVISYGGYQVMKGQATPGEFFSFFTSLMMAYKPMKAVAGMNVSLNLGFFAISNVFRMMDDRPKIVSKPDAIELKNVKGEIVFENVDFSYIAERTALNNISFKVDAGKTCALVGYSGGGKSTIIAMLLRFYDPISGSIKIDGHDLRDITTKSLRDSISYVGQDIQLFDDTILENIKYSKRDASMEDVIEAAKMAQAHDFITETVNGYNTRIGQNGIKLSGGQRQRIAIARAFLKNSKILLLDEATSALDPVAEKLIQKALDNLMKNRTAIIVAHRLSTIINADNICVISKGSVIEQGTHQQLLDIGKEYARLYSSNFDEIAAA